MKIAIIGGGASGVFAAIRIKESHPTYSVVIFERNDKLLKKIYATGNGRCNFANSSSIENAFNKEGFVTSILNDFNHEKVNEYFDSIGIKSRKIDTNYYPYSLSAATVAEKLISRLNELQVDIRLNCKISSYTKVNGKYNVGTNENFDLLVFAAGGKSSPQFGTDGNLYSELGNLGYKIDELMPSLCPVKVKENVNKLDGVRAKANVKIISNNTVMYEEEGEVQFKNDGLSGIVIFNMVFMIHKLNLLNSNLVLSLDFVPENKEFIKPSEFSSYLNDKLATYLNNNKLDIHNTMFTYKKLYGFDASHVSSGGVSLDSLSSSLESKFDKNVFFIGEIVNVDAKCGGYNLMWAWASAEKVAKCIQ